MKTYFEKTVFHGELKVKLTQLVNRPSCLSKFTILYGEPGTGKTSFAKEFAKEFSSLPVYFPVNETGLGTPIFEEIEKHTTSGILLADETKQFDKIIVVDEFHNATKNQQDKFKTLFDELGNHCRFIFILNTNSRVRGKQIHDLISPAMYSRMVRISFDVPERLVDEVVEKSKRLYPDLTETIIRATLPDHRQLALKQQMAEWEAA